MSNRKNKTQERDEVEELLRASEEEVLLKLSVDAHMSRVAPSYIDTDLQRRFQALKKPSSSSSARVVPKPKLQQLSPETRITSTEKEANCEASDEKDELKGVLRDDLFARFAALKASLPSSVPPNTSDGGDQSVRPNENGDTEDDDEVEKIIQWAKDAARLDPSSATDDDDDDGNDEKEEEDEDDDGDDGDDNNHGDRVEGDKRGKEQK